MPKPHQSRKATERLVAEGAPKIGPAVLLSSIGINVLALALPLVLLQIFDRVIPNRSHETLQVLFIGLCAVVVLDIVFKICRIVLLGLEGQDYERVLSARVLRHILHADPDAIEEQSSGVHYDRLGAVAGLRDFHAGQARLLMIDLPFSLLFVAMIVLIGGWLVLVPLGCFAVLFAFRAMLKGLQIPVLERRQEVDERRYSFLVEFLSQIVTVKSFSMEPQMLRRYEMLQTRSVEASRQLTQFSQAFGAIFSQGAIVAMGLFGSWLVIGDALGVGELAACMLLNGRVVQPMLKLLSFWVQAEAVETSRGKLRELLETPQRETPQPRVGDFEGHLYVKDLAATLPKRGTVFSGLDADLAPGECLAITGPDNSGKSTLLRLILGEREPSQGRILVGGRPPALMRDFRGRGKIVVVESQPVVFDGSILDNIALFGDASAVEAAMEAAREIGLEDDIHRLAEGYDTPVTSMQSAATRGFLQRLCIARALALRPKMLLLNEANTALDHRADAAVLAAMKRLKGRTTLILVSRRPSWLALGDHRIDLGAKDDLVSAWDEDRRADIAAQDERRTA